MTDENDYKTLGILGGGQLGRMSAQAAARLGIRTVIFTPETDSPAAQVADDCVVAAYDDEAALRRFAGIVDVISYEFENIPVKTVEYLSNLKPVYPEKRLLEVAQDRIHEKTFLNRIGIPTARFETVDSPADITKTLLKWGADTAIIKTRRFGYDGKGQLKFKKSDNENEAFLKLGGHDLIIEEIVDFSCEISVVTARDAFGTIRSYTPVMNEHKNHILHKTTAPAPISANIAQQAVILCENLAQQIDLRGVLALEMFVTKDGGILANEIAPRTHNSGHWTMDCCAVSQFEQHVRAVCGLPLGDPAQHHDGVMINLIGDDINHLDEYRGNPAAHIHLYGKAEAKPGRKMGHVTVLGAPFAAR